MLYLHCGWMKTGTTSLRAALARHQDWLADSGMVYAPEWRSLTKPLQSQGAGSAIDQFKHFLERHAEGDVLCSNEWLASLLWTEQSLDIFRRLLVAADDVMPVRCIWTLRRADDAIGSMYAWLLLRENEMPAPAAYLSRLRWMDRTFVGLRSLEDAPVGSSVYVKYDSKGRHNAELLNAFGLPAEQVGVIEGELTDAPRLNVAFSHKQVVALLHWEALAARSGVTLDKAALVDVFTRGRFRFENDRSFVLGDDHARRVLHERALEAARRSGFTPYVRFFEDAEVAESPASIDMAVEVISDEDLNQLVAHMRQTIALRP